MSSRVLELILKINNQSGAEVSKFRAEMEAIFRTMRDGGSGSPFTGTEQGAKSAAKAVGAVTDAVEDLKKETSQIPSGGFEGLKQGASGLVEVIGQMSFGFNNVLQTLGTIQSVGAGAFEFLIGSNEKLNAQLLSSQTNLASATRIFRDGVELTDPTEKIKSTSDALGKALKDIERDTQSLVGVTSEDVNGLFQITLTNAAALNKQSKEFPGPIEAAQKLTTGWAASMKVIGLELHSANEEINSIIKGNITQDSLLAKNLGINNAMVNQWKAQGTFVDELNKRLEVFVAGNAIAANSIEGISSNFLDVFQILGREAGKPFLQPIVGALAKVYATLATNTQNILDYFKGISDVALASFTKIGEGVAPIFDGLVQSVAGLAPALSSTFAGTADLVTGIIAVIAPAVQGLVLVFNLAVTALSPFLDLTFKLLGGIGKILGVVGGNMTKTMTALAGVASSVTSVFNGVIGAVGSVGEKIGGIFGEISKFGGAVLAAFQPFIDFFSNTIGGLIGGAVSQVSGFFGAIGAALSPIKAVFDAVAGAIGGALSAIGNFIAGAAKIGAIVTGLAVFGPILTALFSVFATGALIVKAFGIAIGEIGKTLGIVATALQPIGAAIVKPFQDAFSAISSVFQSGSDAVSDFTGNVFKAFAKIGNDIVKFFEPLGKAFETLASTADSLSGGVFSKSSKAYSDAMGKAKDSTDELAKSTGQLEIKGNTLQVLGDTYDQLAEKAASAQRVIEAQGNGTPQQFTDAAKQLIDVTQQQVEAGKISTEEGRKRLLALAKDKALEADLQKKAFDTATKLRAAEDQESETRNKDYVASIQARIAAGLVSEKAGQEEILEVQRAGAAKKLADLRAQLKEQEQAGLGGGDAAEKLRSQITAQQGEIAKIEQGARKQVLDAKKADLDAEKALLDAQVGAVALAAESGKLSSVEAARQTTELKKQQLDLQLANLATQVEAELALIAKGGGDPNKLKNLQAQQKTLQTQRATEEIEGARKVQEARFAEIEKAEKKATEALKSAELERQIESQKLVNAGTITKEEASQRRLTDTKKTLEAELAAERKSLAALEAIPKTGNKKTDEQREEKIRESKTQTAQLTLKLLENEQAVQEAITAAAIKKIEKQQAAAKNITEAAVQGAQKELAAQDLIVKSLERKSTLLKSQQDLQSALTGLVKDQYSQATSLLESQFAAEDKLKASQEQRAEILKKISEAKTPEEKDTAQKELDALDKQERREKQLRDLKIEAKRAELASLLKSQALALQALDLENQKTAALRKQEEIRLRIEAIQAKANVAQAEADLAKVKADTKATPEAIRAAELQIEAAKAKVTGVDEQQKALGEQKGLDAQSSAAQKSILVAQQAQAVNQVKGEIAQLTPEAADDARLQKEALAAARQGTVALNESFAGLSGSTVALKDAIDGLANSTKALNSGTTPQSPPTPRPIPARRFGGDTPAGPVVGAEVGPELVSYAGGGFGLMENPGLYNLPSDGFVYTADQTAAMLQPTQTFDEILRAAPILRNNQNFSIAGGVAGAAGGIDIGALVNEVRALRNDIASRPSPEQSNSFTFVNEVNPDGRALALSQRLMQQQLRRGGF
jgi:hypothetical protein